MLALFLLLSRTRRRSKADCAGECMYGGGSRRANLTGTDTATPWPARHGAALCLQMLAAHAPALLWGGPAPIAATAAQVAAAAAAALTTSAEALPLAQTGVRLAGSGWARAPAPTLAAHAPALTATLTGALGGDRPSDLRRTAAAVVAAVARVRRFTDGDASLAAAGDAWVPALLACVRDKNMPLRLAADGAMLGLVRAAAARTVPAGDGDALEAAAAQMGGRLDATNARAWTDHYRRVLARLAAEASAAAAVAGKHEDALDDDDELGDQFERASTATSSA
jgi:hypothetical protein